MFLPHGVLGSLRSHLRRGDGKKAKPAADIAVGDVAADAPPAEAAP